MPKPSAAVEPAVKVDPKVRGCLDLIRRKKYQPAVSLCLAALEIDPDNKQVQDAVAKAHVETVKQAAAKAASQAAGQAVAEEASKQAER